MKDGIRPLSRVRSKQRALIRCKEKVIRALENHMSDCRQLADPSSTPDLVSRLSAAN